MSRRYFYSFFLLVVIGLRRYLIRHRKSIIVPLFDRGERGAWVRCNFVEIRKCVYVTEKYGRGIERTALEVSFVRNEQALVRKNRLFQPETRGHDLARSRKSSQTRQTRESNYQAVGQLYALVYNLTISLGRCGRRQRSQ